MPGIRRAEPATRRLPGQPPPLDMNPVPDFSDFFEQRRKSEMSDPLSLQLLVETSRGCWWGVKRQCLFCGLHVQQRGYRKKSLRAVLAELTELRRRHHEHHVTFVDASTCPDDFHTLFPALVDFEPKLEFFCEMRAQITREQAQLLRRAGCRRTQPGIESFSTPVLNLIAKGTTALQNVACLKYLREVGIIPSWNLLFGFPYEDPAEYEKILTILRCITHLTPPKLVTPMGPVRFQPSLRGGCVCGLLASQASSPASPHLPVR